jgi:uncharacterized SAM-dependent methyltransferase
MSPFVRVAIHSSQFPEAVRNDLLECLRSRRVNHKFHYDSYKQTQQWLALHQAYSPCRTDPNCSLVYEQGFTAALRRLSTGPVQVIGLGCGGGQKDVALLKLLRSSDRQVSYMPCDVSAAMVLVAQQFALNVVSESNCFPLVCDLATASDLGPFFDSQDVRDKIGHTTRVFTFFGMMPNFEPDVILPKLASLVGVGNLLLLSANLAPGADYSAGVDRILPLYDNKLTRDWLQTFLLDLGIEENEGRVCFSVERQLGKLNLERVVGDFQFVRARSLQIDSEVFEFRASESIRLFFSYRHTPELIRKMLGQYLFEVIDQWVTPSEEEGVFLIRRVGEH